MSDKNPDNTPFAALKKIKIKNAAPAAPAPRPTPGKSAPPPLDEADLFSRAMTGVARLPGEAGSGRAVAPKAPPRPAARAVDEEAEALSALSDLVSGKVEFEISMSDEYVQGFVRGTDSKIVMQLRAGRYSPEAHLDLHGFTTEEAREALTRFIREAYLSGKRCVLLITGRGVNSPGGLSVLREEVKGWLTRDPLKRVVLAFCTSLSRHGGAGALYALLRKHKKTAGKVRFETGWEI